MTSRTSMENGLAWLYDQINGEEDARVCKEIPEEICSDQPRNFFAYLLANLFNKISDELVSARLTLPWLFSVLGVPVSFIGFLVPIRETGVLMPQLLIAASVRAMPKRKIVWLTGALLSALMLFLMTFIGWRTSGVTAGWLLLICLMFYSLARGLCSVSAKDILGKTISKTRRGRLMGYSVSLAGIAILIIGLLLQSDLIANHDRSVLITFIFIGGLLWLIAFISFFCIKEPEGATEGGGNALDEAFRSLRLIKDDKPFQQYLIGRIFLLSIALVIPYYVILVHQQFQGTLSNLGWLIILSGLANSVSAPLIGKYADHNSRNVMSVAAFLAFIVGLLTWFILYLDPATQIKTAVILILFFLVTISHGAIRLGRKVYLIDLANMDNRAQYVAVSNTVIGLAMMIGGLTGFIADIFNVQIVILLLSMISLAASLYIHKLENVSG